MYYTNEPIIPEYINGSYSEEELESVPGDDYEEFPLNWIINWNYDSNIKTLNVLLDEHFDSLIKATETGNLDLIHQDLIDGLSRTLLCYHLLRIENNPNIPDLGFDINNNILKDDFLNEVLMKQPFNDIGDDEYFNILMQNLIDCV